MPHVIVKLWPGRSEEQKAELAERITQALQAALHSSEASISVAIEEVTRQDWMAKVYETEISPNLDTLYKKPGYDQV